MKIVTCNVNGIRSAFSKGFFDWYKRQRADILCLQELKAHEDQIKLNLMLPKNTFSYWIINNDIFNLNKRIVCSLLFFNYFFWF